uniref:Uncharacterized protein n=1 Tax=Rhizophora mucronata TaxID=61149 RepID=A0A2P2IUK5_RHIMU
MNRTSIKARGWVEKVLLPLVMIAITISTCPSIKFKIKNLLTSIKLSFIMMCQPRGTRRTSFGLYLHK